MTVIKNISWLQYTFIIPVSVISYLLPYLIADFLAHNDCISHPSISKANCTKLIENRLLANAYHPLAGVLAYLPRLTDVAYVHSYIIYTEYSGFLITLL